jgi:hypothetical protein
MYIKYHFLAPNEEKFSLVIRKNYIFFLAKEIRSSHHDLFDIL